MYIDPISNANANQNASFKSVKYVGKALEKIEAAGITCSKNFAENCENAHLTYPTMHVNYLVSDFLKSKGLNSYSDIHKFNSAEFIESYKNPTDFVKADVLIKDYTQDGYKHTFDVEVPAYNYSGKVNVLGNNFFYPLKNPQKLLMRISQDGFFDNLIKNSPLYKQYDVERKEYSASKEMPTIFFEG